MRECHRVYNNDYSKRARDSVAPDSSCVAWLNDGLAWCECWEWCQVTADDLPGMQSVCGPTACRARSHVCTKV